MVDFTSKYNHSCLCTQCKTVGKLESLFLKLRKVNKALLASFSNSQ